MPIEEMSKPGSITAVQVILWIKVALIGLAVCLLVSAGSIAGGQLPQSASTLIGVLLVVYIGYGILLAVLAVKIVDGRNWARITAIVLESISIVMAVTSMSDVGGLAAVIGIGLSITIIICLAQADSREWCSG